MEVEEQIRTMLMFAIVALAAVCFFWTSMGMAVLRLVFARKPEGFYKQYSRGLAVAIGLALVATAAPMVLVSLPDITRDGLLKLASTDALSGIGNALPILYTLFFLNYLVWIIPLVVFIGARHAWPLLVHLDPERPLKYVAVAVTAAAILLIGQQYMLATKHYVENTCQISETHPEGALSPALRDVFKC